MNKFISKFTVSLFAVILIGVISPSNTFATVPKMIGGLNVMMTFPPGSTGCTPADTTRILT